MTAKVVGGVRVVMDEPTRAPINTRYGEPIWWQQIRTLLLADERVVYGCAHCDLTAESPNKIRPHLRSHKPAKPKPPPAPVAGDMTLDELVAKAKLVDRLTADRDKWRQRALKAERDLDTIRKKLRG